MNNGFQTAPSTQPDKPLSAMELAMKKLVNVDRIDEPAEVVYEQTLKKKEEGYGKMPI